MFRSIIPFSALFGLLLTGGVNAGDMPLRGPLGFETFDANGDNMISPQEYVETHNKRKQLREQAGMPIKRMPTPSFTDFDSNGDNLISKEELETGRQAMGRGMMGQGKGSGRGMGPCGRGMGGGFNMPAFGDFDINKDGVLKKDEFLEARGKRMAKRSEQGYALRNAASAPSFEDIDSDGNGEISEQEFAEHQRQHRMMRQQ